MTTIAVKKYKDRIIMVSDSQTTMGYKKREYGRAKFIKLSAKSVIGFSGYALTQQYFNLFLETNKLGGGRIIDIVKFFHQFKKFLNEEIKIGTNKIQDIYESSRALIVVDGKIYDYHLDDAVYEIENRWAIGTGADWALASLDVQDDIEKAVETACKHDLHSSLPLHKIEIKI